MSDTLSRAELLRLLTESADSIRDQLADLRGQVQRALNKVDISDSMAESVQRSVSDLRDEFDRVYNLMEQADAILPDTDEDYKGLRAQLIEDFRVLGVLDNRFRLALTHEDDREKDEEPEEEPEEEQEEEPEEEPEEGPEEEEPEEEPDDSRDKRQKKLATDRLKRETAAHNAAVSAAEAEALRRQTMADGSRPPVSDSYEEERLREERLAAEARAQSDASRPADGHEAERLQQKEVDERLAREAEDKAHREAMTRQDTGESFAPEYGYQGPAYDSKRPAEEETRPRYSREEHEELVEKYRQREEDITYDRPEDTVGKEQGSGAPGFAPVGFAPAGYEQPAGDGGFHMPPPPARYREQVSGREPDAIHYQTAEQNFEHRVPEQEAAGSGYPYSVPGHGQKYGAWEPAQPTVPDRGYESRAHEPSVPHDAGAHTSSAAEPHGPAADRQEHTPFVSPVPPVSFREMAANRQHMAEYMQGAERPATAWPDGRSDSEPATEPVAFKPSDVTLQRSGEDLMREARERVSHVNVPDIGQMEMASSGGSVFSLYHASARGGSASYEPPSVSPSSGVYQPQTWAYVPTVAGEQKEAGTQPTVSASLGGRLAEKQGVGDTTFRQAPVWSAATAAAGCQYNALHTAGTQVAAAPLFHGQEHVQIYGIVSGDGKKVFIDKAPAGQLDTVFRAHQSGANPLTAPMFQQAGEHAPVMTILADYTGKRSDASGAVQAFAKRCQDSGIAVTVAGGAVGRIKLDNLSHSGRELYEHMQGTPTNEILDRQSTASIRGKGKNLVIERVSLKGGTADDLGVSFRKDGAGVTGASMTDKAKAGAKGAVSSDSRASAVKSAVDKFNTANQGTARRMTSMVRQYLVSSLTQGNDGENPFIELDRGWVYAQKGMTIARAAALPATTTSTAMAMAVQRAVLEKGVYHDLSAAGNGFSRLYKNASDKVLHLQDALEMAEASSSPTAAGLREELVQAKCSLHRMDKFRAMKSNSASMVEASKAMANSRGFVRHNLHLYDKEIGDKLRGIRDSVNTTAEFASMRTMYGKDLFSVTDRQLAASMADLKHTGRNLRGQIKVVKLQLKTASPDAAAGLQHKLKKLTADAKSNSVNYNLHRKLMDKRTEAAGLSAASREVRGRVIRFRATAKAGMKTTAGLLTGYLVRCAATSGDYGLNGISIVSSDLVAVRAGASFLGRHTGLSRITSAVGRSVRNLASDGTYWVASHVKAGVARAAAPVTNVVKVTANSAVSAATHGTSVIANRAATALSKATPTQVKAAGAAAKGGIAAVKKVASSAANKLASSTAGRAALAVGRAFGHVAAAVSHVVGAITGFIGAAMGLLLSVVSWLLIIIILVSCVFSIFDSGKSDADGKVDMSEYDGYVNESWDDYVQEMKDEVDPADYGCESVEWDTTDIPTNKLVILTMLSVRTEYQTNTEDASKAGANVSISEIQDYLSYITGALNPLQTHVDERTRQVWVSDGEDGGHYETETYYVLMVSFDPYTFAGTGADYHLINGDGETSLDSVDQYGTIPGSSWESWDESNRELCELMYTSDWNELYSGITGITVSTGNLESLTADAEAVLEALPEDLSPERQAVVETALSLVGKVNYFWGGKSLVIGWDDRWGTSKQVTAAGSSSTGTYRPFGLDCSGFVDWVFYNATGGEYVIGHGGGAHAQHTYCTPISWDEAQIGDLVFYPEDSHVGIVCGFADNGTPLIVHCASGQNNVVVTGLQDFETIGRPNVYNNWTY